MSTNVFIVNSTSVSPDDCGVSSPSIKNYYVPENLLEALYAEAEHGITEIQDLLDFLEKYEDVVPDMKIIGVVNIAMYFGGYTTIGWELMIFGHPMDSNFWSNEEK